MLFNACGSAGDPLRTNAVQSDQCLLVLALYRHRVNAGTAISLQDRFTISSVRLTTPPIGLHVVGRNQGDSKPRAMR